MPDSAQPYNRPPIIEAVIEIRFFDPLDQKELAKINKALKVLYQHEEMTRDVNFAINFSERHDLSPTAAMDEQRGFKRASPDLAQIVVLKATSFVVAQLAPYPGWDDFYRRFQRDWNVWKKTIGYKKINRIGVRYINRIDIPINDANSINYEEFLNIWPRLPEELGPTLAYGVQAQFPLDDLGCLLTINSASVPSPLLGHSSFLFDQDIVTNSVVSQNDGGMFDQIEKIRKRKNEVFELCVTEKSRALFKT